MKKITIEKLNEGYLCIDENKQRYAVADLQPWIIKYFEGNATEVSPVPGNSMHIPVTLTSASEEHETTTEKVLRLALEQIEVTGNYSQTKIAKEVGMAGSSINYHIVKIKDKLETARRVWQDERDKPMLRTQTRIEE